MEILHLLNDKYDKIEYHEIKKLIRMQEENLNKLNNFKNVSLLNDKVCESLKSELYSNNNDIETLNECFYENNRIFKHILQNLLPPKS